MVKKVFQEIIDKEVKIVTELIIEKGKLSHFSVALLKLSGKKWSPIRRWDNSHGHAHVHIYTGKTEKIHKIDESPSIGKLVNKIRSQTKRNYKTYVENFQNEKRLR